MYKTGLYGKAVLLTVFTVLLASVFSAASSVSSVPPVWIDKNGNGAYDSGEPGYTTIQDALDDADPYDVIYVEPGIYNESINITKPVTLLSTGGAEQTKIDAGWRDYTVKMTSGDVTLGVEDHGFNITGFRLAGIYGKDTSSLDNLWIGGNVIYGNETSGQIGIDIQSPGFNITIRSNEIVYVPVYGILLWGATAPGEYIWISQNDIHGTGPSKGGIMVLWCNYVYIVENSVEGPGVGEGIVVHTSSNVIIYANTVENFEWGISMSSKGGFLVLGNQVTGCDSGAYLGAYGKVYDATLLFNTFDGNTYGIYLQGEPYGVRDVAILNNILVGNEKAGIAGIGSKAQYIYIAGNEISGNSHGVVLDHCSYVWLAVNNITENSIVDTGLTLTGVNDVEAYVNNIYGNVYGAVTDTGLDARWNWWGAVNGPYHPTGNPGGSGDEVSDNVVFEPWLLAPLRGYFALSSWVAHLLTGEDVIDATSFVGVKAEYTASGGFVMAFAKFEHSPVPEPDFPTIDNYVAVLVNDTSKLEAVTLYIEYDEEEIGDFEERMLIPYWFDKETGTWVKCSDYGVDTEDNQVVVRIRGDTKPSIDQLSDPVFTLRVLSKPVGGAVTQVDVLEVLTPYLITFIAVSMFVLALYRRMKT